MGLREDAEGHWATVENMFKKAATEAFYNDDGTDRRMTAEQWAGLGVKNMGVLVWLWGDGYRIMRDNYREIEHIVRGDNLDAEQAAAQVGQLVTADVRDNVEQRVRDIIAESPLPVEPNKTREQLVADLAASLVDDDEKQAVFDAILQVFADHQ